MKVRHVRIGAAALAAALAAQAATAEDAAPVWVHRAAQGDTIWGIAQQYLADPGRYRALQRLNRVQDPRHLPVGTPIRIPLVERGTEPASVI